MLSKFPNKTLKIGAKVSLSPESRYRNGEGGGRSINPTGVVGHVREVSDEVYVNWDSGQQMVNYRLNDYDLIAEGEPGYLEV